MRALSTSSSVTSLRYCEYGLRVACLCDLTEILPKCSSVVPYLRICSRPAWPHTAAAAEQPLLAHLLDAHRHRHVVHPRRDRHEGFAKRGRAGRAGVRDVD